MNKPGVSTLVVSVETLLHFQCGKCGKWWSIGDAPLDRGWFCPWCGQFGTAKPNTPAPRVNKDKHVGS